MRSQRIILKKRAIISYQFSEYFKSHMIFNNWNVLEIYLHYIILKYKNTILKPAHMLGVFDEDTYLCI